MIPLCHRVFTCTPVLCARAATNATFKLRSKRHKQQLGAPKGFNAANMAYSLDHHCFSGKVDLSKHFITMGIETSCDDTGVGIVRSDGLVLANVVHSQHAIHKSFGGIVPMLAKTSHDDVIDSTIEKALVEAGLQSMADIDAIAVTRGPGLELCLRVGCIKAEALARMHKIPFVTVHHLDAHCVVTKFTGQEVSDLEMSHNAIQNTIEHATIESELSLHYSAKVQYPFLALLVSGGHTLISVCEGVGKYTILGGTCDDSLGECFDKISRMLQLEDLTIVQRSGKTGGAAVEVCAKQYYNSNKQKPPLPLSPSGSLSNSTQSLSKHALRQLEKNYKKQWKPTANDFQLTTPMLGSNHCDFSYSGVKNAFRLLIESQQAELSQSGGDDTSSSNLPMIPIDVKYKICAAVQEVCFDHVRDRLQNALQYLESQSAAGDHNTDKIAGDFPPISSLVVVGGVAANEELRRCILSILQHRHDLDPTRPKLQLVCPPPSLCTDNGVMVACAGIDKLLLGISDYCEGHDVELDDKIARDSSNTSHLRGKDLPLPRWPLGSFIRFNEL